jgi:hypothetical protein
MARTIIGVTVGYIAVFVLMSAVFMGVFLLTGALTTEDAYESASLL